MEWLLRHRQTKGAEIDRRIPNGGGACSLRYPMVLMVLKKQSTMYLVSQ